MSVWELDYSWFLAPKVTKFPLELRSHSYINDCTSPGVRYTCMRDKWKREHCFTHFHTCSRLSSACQSAEKGANPSSASLALSEFNRDSWHLRVFSDVI